MREPRSFDLRSPFSRRESLFATRCNTCFGRRVARRAWRGEGSRWRDPIFRWQLSDTERESRFPFGESRTRTANRVLASVSAVWSSATVGFLYATAFTPGVTASQGPASGVLASARGFRSASFRLQPSPFRTRPSAHRLSVRCGQASLPTDRPSLSRHRRENRSS